jgi:hypothetical protein
MEVWQGTGPGRKHYWESCVAIWHHWAFHRSTPCWTLLRAAAVHSISVETVLGGGEAKGTKLKRWLVKATGAAASGGGVVALQRGVTTIHGGFRKKEHHATAWSTMRRRGSDRNAAGGGEAQGGKRREQTEAAGSGSKPEAAHSGQMVYHSLSAHSCRALSDENA